ncbi:uncharacterized protein MONOS_18082 [Monocercomonoides exilis]|uniref:uncharacterized protein n=1 Tax=Monocercomonoides exilis TaxID=2049356 RepID=UPI00355A3267|nr:hypothetical protein MONOS_18082 [Monocercomonoides exilis]
MDVWEMDWDEDFDVEEVGRGEGGAEGKKMDVANGILLLEWKICGRKKEGWGRDGKGMYVFFQMHREKGGSYEVEQVGEFLWMRICGTRDGGGGGGRREEGTSGAALCIGGVETEEDEGLTTKGCFAPKRGKILEAFIFLIGKRMMRNEMEEMEDMWRRGVDVALRGNGEKKKVMQKKGMERGSSDGIFFIASFFIEWSWLSYLSGSSTEDWK